MTINQAVTLFREISVGLRFPCSIDYREGTLCVVTVLTRNPHNGRELTSQEIDKLTDLVHRYGMQALFDDESKLIMVNDSFASDILERLVIL